MPGSFFFSGLIKSQINTGDPRSLGVGITLLMKVNRNYFCTAEPAVLWNRSDHACLSIFRSEEKDARSD